MSASVNLEEAMKRIATLEARLIQAEDVLRFFDDAVSPVEHTELDDMDPEQLGRLTMRLRAALEQRRAFERTAQGRPEAQKVGVQPCGCGSAGRPFVGHRLTCPLSHIPRGPTPPPERED